MIRLTVRASDRLAAYSHRAPRFGVLPGLIASIASAVLIASGAPAMAAGTSRGAGFATPATMTSASAHPRTTAISFAVLANIPSSVANEPPTQAMLQWIAEVGQVHFIVDLGNVRGADESCGNALFARRQALLDATPAPLIFVPGLRDWVDCARPGAGAFDPVERLDAVRDLFLSGNLSLGSPPMRVIRQSELPAFAPYRENMRWIDDSVVFATLNVPGGNNHFVDGGGRNGEYEDREVANRNWIDHAVTDAQRRHARGLVFLFAGDPGFASRAAQAAGQHAGASHWTVPFDWWFRRPRERDGYASLRRDLLRAVARFDGPVLIIHGRDTPHPVVPASIEVARSNSSAAAKREWQHSVHEARRDARKAASALPPTVAVETLTHAPDGLLLHDVQQVMVDNPVGSRQWLRVTLPTAAETQVHGIPSSGTRGNASGTGHTRGTGRERVPPTRESTFQIRVESTDDAADEGASSPANRPNLAHYHDVPPGISPAGITSSVVGAAATNATAAAARAPGTPIKTTDSARGAGMTGPAVSAPAGNAQAVSGASAAPTNDMGLPPWPGKAFRFRRNGIDNGATDGTSDGSEAQDIDSVVPRGDTTAHGGGSNTTPDGHPDSGNLRGHLTDTGNAKSTSGHDVLQFPTRPAGSTTSTEDASDARDRTTGMRQDPLPLPGDVPESSDPIETGIAEGDVSTGTSALNGITQPKMLPLPPLR